MKKRILLSKFKDKSKFKEVNEMKRNALTVLLIFVLLSLIGVATVAGKVLFFDLDDSIWTSEVTLEEARKIALKRVEGTVIDEYSLEDEEEEIAVFAFVIKRKDSRVFEVDVDAKTGEVTKVEEQTEEEEGEDSPVGIDEDEESTEPEDETNEKHNPVGSAKNDRTDSTEAGLERKLSVEAARAKALKKVKGEVQSAEVISLNGKPFYLFTIHSRKDKIVKVRVDAISGKAKKLKPIPSKL